MQLATSWLMFVLLVASSGCAMCTSCEDDTYAAYGGKWQRADMTHGRVGSAFTEAGFDTAGGELITTPVPAEIVDDPPAEEYLEDEPESATQ